MTTKVLAKCKNYNGHKNVLFMMDTDDHRLFEKAWGYETIDSKAEYNRKEKTLTSGDTVYHVYSDRSLSKKG